VTARRAIAAVLLVVASTLIGGCESNEPPPEPIRPSWREVSLPAAPSGERLAPRAVAVCGGRWFLTGSFVAADGATRPAAWTSRDGDTWTTLVVTPMPDSYYGRRSLIYTAACRDGVLAAVGGKPGGAHGNPRVSSWILSPGSGSSGPDGAGEALIEVGARFELYGGPKAVNVGRLVAGPDGWLIAGNRASGAAVWLSSDGREFILEEPTPGLAHEPGLYTWAADAVAHGGEWTVVGGTITEGRIDRDAAAWTSTDGALWRRQEVPAGPEYDEITRVVAHGDGLVAIGLNGATFQAWRHTGDSWRMVGRFGSTRPGTVVPGPYTAPVAPALASAGGNLLAAAGDGTQYRLWSSADSGERWREVASPVPLPAGASTGVALAAVSGDSGGSDRVLLVVDDGRAGRIFVAEMPD
jgi:hypothetical protein